MRGPDILRGLTLITLFLTGCTVQEDTVTVRIVATTDVHGRVFDTDCLDGTERAGSLSKFASFLKGQRKEYGNVIYLDAGDMLQGSVEMYQDLTAQFRRESLAAQAFNLLGCDATVMGNHDFAVGGNSYDRYFRSISCPVLGANVYYEKYGDYLPPYKIFDVKGYKIAVIGFTTPVVNYSIPKDMTELDLADIIETAGHWMPILQNDIKADVIIGLIHSGYDSGRMDDEGLCENAVKKLVEKVPGFDMIVFGHDHKKRSLKMADCNGDSVLLLNPGPFVMNAAVATLTITPDESDRPGVRSRGELVDITGEIPDKRFMRKLSGWYDDVANYSDSVIGTVSIPLEINGVLWRNSSVMDWVHSIQLNYNGAQVSLSSPIITKTLVPSGDVRIKDVFGLYQFDNTMVSVMMSGSEIKDVLEYSTALFYNTVTDGEGSLLKWRQGAQSGCRLPQCPIKNLITAAGIDYEIDVTKPVGERIKIISMSDGRRFEPDRSYRTTINSFLYAGDESALFKATDIKRTDMPGRLNGSSKADIRYYMLTDLALKHEMDAPVRIRRTTNWKLVPEEIVSECLARDTLDFNIIEIQTSHLWD